MSLTTPLLAVTVPSFSIPPVNVASLLAYRDVELDAGRCAGHAACYRIPLCLAVQLLLADGGATPSLTGSELAGSDLAQNRLV
jgi:hypothetical protein